MSERFIRDWREYWVDRMGLIVALSGENRFTKLLEFKRDLDALFACEQLAVKEAIRLRFTPSDGIDGCTSGIEAVKQVLL